MNFVVSFCNNIIMLQPSSVKSPALPFPLVDAFNLRIFYLKYVLYTGLCLKNEKRTPLYMWLELWWYRRLISSPDYKRKGLTCPFVDALKLLHRKNAKQKNEFNFLIFPVTFPRSGHKIPFRLKDRTSSLEPF